MLNFSLLMPCPIEFNHRLHLHKTQLEKMHNTVVILLILMKISDGATRCQMFRLKCTKRDFRWGSDSKPIGEI